MWKRQECYEAVLHEKAFWTTSDANTSKRLHSVSEEEWCLRHPVGGIHSNLSKMSSSDCLEVMECSWNIQAFQRSQQQKHCAEELRQSVMRNLTCLAKGKQVMYGQCVSQSVIPMKFKVAASRRGGIGWILQEHQNVFSVAGVEGRNGVKYFILKWNRHEWVSACLLKILVLRKEVRR